MEKSKLLTLTVISLLLINIGTLVFLLLGQPHPRNGTESVGRPKPKEIIIEQLGLDVSQIKVYEGLIHEHRQCVDSFDRIIRESKVALYQNLAHDSSEVVDAALISKINAAQKQIELTHYQHFLAIKKLCRPEQKEKFEALTEELPRLFGKPPHPRHEP